MKYSIIVPVYKVEKYLRECVDSILAQNYKDYELILVDDGSPDKCPEICDEYAAAYENVKVLHQPNGKLARARNSGMNIAKGEYVIFIDSDDYLSSEDALAEIDKALECNPDVLIFGFKKYFESRDTYGFPVCNFYSQAQVLSPETFLAQLLKNDSYTGTAWAKVIRRDLLISNNIKFKEGMISEDSDWYLQVMEKAKSYSAINKALYIYRMRPDSISHDVKEQSLTDNLWILENWPRRIQNSQADKGLKEVLMRILARYAGNTMVLYCSYGASIRKKYYKRVKNILYLLDNSITPRALIIHKCVRFLGLKLTTVLLSTANKLKKRT